MASVDTLSSLSVPTYIYMDIPRVVNQIKGALSMVEMWASSKHQVVATSIYVHDWLKSLTDSPKIWRT